MSGISRLRMVVSLFTVMMYVNVANSQQLSERQYQRASICNMMVKRPNLQYNKEIEYVFRHMEKPERFNDHGLGVSTVMLANVNDLEKAVTGFVDNAEIGKRMVAKWFDRDKTTGAFDVNLIRERGLYNATLLDVNLASKQARGLAVLEDAGENLISKTFLVVSDIFYIDKSDRWSQVKDVVSASSNIAWGWKTGQSFQDDDDPFKSKDLAWLTEGVIAKIKGFKVKIASYLFQLEWDDETAGTFYTNYYQDASSASAAKKDAFKKSKGEFKMKYVGMVENKSSETVLSGVKTNEDLIRKVCTRALDQNLSELQHKFEDFRIKAPLVSTEPIVCAIGMKEDITADSRFEVLEEIEKKDGSRTFKRVGVIKPFKDKIWDNRYMATEEGAKNAGLGGTTFQKVSGGPFYAGMLIREMGK